MVRRNGSNGMLTTRQLARLLNVHINTVRRWDKQGLLKAYRIGPRGDRRYSREDVDVFLGERCGAGQKVG
jgi:excisionase family DNA binding protein